MTISVNVGFPPGADKPSVQLSMDPEDAVDIIEGLATALKTIPVPQLQALHSVLSSLNLTKP